MGGILSPVPAGRTAGVVSEANVSSVSINGFAVSRAELRESGSVRAGKRFLLCHYWRFWMASVTASVWITDLISSDSAGGVMPLSSRWSIVGRNLDWSVCFLRLGPGGLLTVWCELLLLSDP